MTRIIAALAVVVFLSACERASTQKPAPDPSKVVTAQTPAPAPDVPKEVSAPPPVPTPEVAKELAAQAENAAKEATQAVTELPKELADAAQPSTTTDKLKELIGNVNVDTLKALAEKLLQALQGQEGAAQSLKDQIAGLSLTDLAKGGELKKSLEQTGATITTLKDKLKVVTDKLAASGVDVSKYTAVLGK